MKMLTADRIPFETYEAAVRRIELHDDPCAEYEIGGELWPATMVVEVFEEPQRRERMRQQMLDRATGLIAQALRDEFDATSQTRTSLVMSRRFVTVEMGEFDVLVQVDVIHRDDPEGL